MGGEKAAVFDRLVQNMEEWQQGFNIYKHAV